jgi:general nucleoside transport system permease protein
VTRATRAWSVGALALALALVLLSLQGLAPWEAVRQLARGAFGSTPAWCHTLGAFAPLLLCAAGVLLAFAAGLWNIGAEGQLLAGALAAAWAGIATGSWLAALAAGALAGALWAAVPAALAIWRRVPEVLSTLMLNSVALELLRWLVTGPLQEPSHQFPQSAPLPPSARLPQVELARASALDLGIPLALAAVLLIGWLLARTRFGLALRAGAQSPRLVRALALPLARWRFAAFALGGALAGLAGAVQVSGIAGAADRSLASGTGYAAVAAALLARLSARRLPFAALLFAALAVGTAALQFERNLPGIDRFGLVLQGLVILALLAGRAPETQAAGGST